MNENSVFLQHPGATLMFLLSPQSSWIYFTFLVSCFLLFLLLPTPEDYPEVSPPLSLSLKLSGTAFLSSHPDSRWRIKLQLSQHPKWNSECTAPPPGGLKECAVRRFGPPPLPTPIWIRLSPNAALLETSKLVGVCSSGVSMLHRR